MTSVFNYKQVIAVRTDIGMSVGKIAVQVAHASVSAVEECRKIRMDWLRGWMGEGQKKAVVKVRSEAELLELKREADGYGIPNYLVVDAGLTELRPGTITALAVGPGPSELVDKVTGNLPLL